MAFRLKSVGLFRDSDEAERVRARLVARRLSAIIMIHQSKPDRDVGPVYEVAVMVDDEASDRPDPGRAVVDLRMVRPADHGASV